MTRDTAFSEDMEAKLRQSSSIMRDTFKMVTRTHYSVTRTNTLRADLADDTVVVGASSGLYSTTAIEVLGEHDLDFLFVDFEHNGPSVWDSLAIQNFVRAAEHADVELIVRLPSAVKGDHGPMIRKILDTGVKNVVLPRVKTAEEVKAAVEGSRFEYESEPGERGVGAARGSRWGADIGPDWIASEDSEVLCGIMVETREAVEHIEEILSVPELGFVFIGSMDLSVALGAPTETSNPRFTEAVETIREACDEANVPCGQLGAADLSPSELVAKGDLLVRVGSDIGAIRAAFDENYEDIR